MVVFPNQVRMTSEISELLETDQLVNDALKSNTFKSGEKELGYL